ncbi:MAG: sigma-54-dependent Fis family transcriptional regulator, partial [Deltaproteobacteria bacterium]
MEEKSILVVDDEPDMRTALTQALASSGYSVLSASNGHEALEKVKKENFRIIITDVKMPQMSGIDFLKEVKKISPQVPVIMITGYGTITNAVEAMKKGASDYITKPFSLESLESAVRKVWKESTELSKKETCLIEIKRRSGNKVLVTQEPNMMEVIERARTVASSNANILIQGESGTGKELLAAFIHQCSPRATKPYVAVNCAALPEGLAESELFGHEKGAFTGAIGRKLGKFELAQQGTIVLDEISELPLPLQAKLLRVIQEREIDRVGGSRTIPIDVRIIAISNLDLKKAIKEGRFREDLFFRLNVVPLAIPPLRERKKDIPLLANYFLKKYASKNNKPVKEISPEAMSLLLKYEWKGNVRELENTIQRAVLLSTSEVILP